MFLQSGDAWRVDGHLNASRVRMLKLYEKDYGGAIPLDTYMLMGEPTKGSLDSSRLGLIHRQDIIGRIVSLRLV